MAKTELSYMFKQEGVPLAHFMEIVETAEQYSLLNNTDNLRMHAEHKIDELSRDREPYYWLDFEGSVIGGSYSEIEDTLDAYRDAFHERFSEPDQKRLVKAIAHTAISGPPSMQ